MAKRTTPRAQAEDTATAPRPARPRRSKADTGDPPAEPLGVPPAPLDAQAPIDRWHEPTEDDIRRRAYERYLERGGSHGMDFEDWLDAERDLKQKTAAGRRESES